MNGAAVPLTAVHYSNGRLDATLEDLGVGLGWDALHRARPRPRLACPACGAAMHAKVSARGLRFFAHDAAATDCPSHGETLEHQQLKRDVAAAARRAGWRAAVEVRGPGWRADVLTTNPRDEQHRMAWEVQLSSSTVEEILERTGRYTSSGVAVCWLTTREPPWLGQVPAVQVQPGRYGGWIVRDGHRRLLDTRPLSQLHAVDVGTLTVVDDLEGTVTQRWRERTGGRLRPPWLTWPQILLGAHRNAPLHTRLGGPDDTFAEPDGVPRTLEYRCRVGWGRSRPVPLSRFAAGVRTGRIVPVELTAPHRDVGASGRQGQIAWTTVDYLDQAVRYTAFALGWPVIHRDPCCVQHQDCGGRGCTVLNGNGFPEAHLCSGCHGDLVNLVLAFEEYEAQHVQDTAAATAVHLHRDNPLVYQPPTLLTATLNS